MTEVTPSVNIYDAANNEWVFVASGDARGGGGSGDEEVAVGATLPTTADLWVNPADVGSGYPTAEIAVYKMMWPANAGRVSTLPTNVNVVRLAFVQGSPPALVGYGAEGKTTLKADLTAFRARGNKVMLSYGGGGGSIDTTKPDEIIASYDTIKADLGGNVDGLDWDVEMAGAGMDLDGVLKVSKAIAARGGAVTFVPNGSNVDAYLPCAAACQDAGCLDSYGHQFYDAVVDAAAVRHRINQAISAGIPIAKIAMGMMIPEPGDNAANYWTNQQCHDYMAQFMGEFPGLQRAYLWHMSRQGTTQWITDMDALFPPSTAGIPTASLKYRDPADSQYKTFPTVGVTPSEMKSYVDGHEWSFSDEAVDARGWDLNGATSTGFYYVTYDSPNAPIVQSGYLTVLNEYGGDGTAQMWIGYEKPPRVFFRTLAYGSWSTWFEPGGGGGSALTVQDEGTNLTVRSTLNFIGAGVTVTDNAGSTRTDVTIAGGAGGGTTTTGAVESPWLTGAVPVTNTTKTANLAKWIAARQQMSTRLVRIACIGNSETYGWSAGEPNSHLYGWPFQLAALLNPTAYGRVDTANAKSAYNSGTETWNIWKRPYIAMSGSWTYTSPGGAANDGYLTCPQGGTGALTYTHTGTRMVFAYIDRAVTFTYKVDSGSLVTVTGTNTGTIKEVVTATVSAGSHVLTINPPTGGSQAVGIVYLGAAPTTGLLVANFGVPSMSTGDWWTGGNAVGSSLNSTLKPFNPDLVLFQLPGGSDESDGILPAQVQTNIENIVAWVKANTNADIILQDRHSISSTAGYNEAIDAAATSTGVPLFLTGEMFANYATLWEDNATSQHLTSVAHGRRANGLAKALTAEYQWEPIGRAFAGTGSGGTASTEPRWPATVDARGWDVDAITSVGFYETSGASTNIPVAEDGYIIATRERGGTATDGDYRAQLWLSGTGTPRIYMRICQANVWGAWTQIGSGGSVSGDYAKVKTEIQAITAASTSFTDYQTRIAAWDLGSKRNSFMGIASGTAVTPANSGGTSGDAFTVVVGSMVSNTSADLTTAYDRGVVATLTSSADSYVSWRPVPVADTGYFRFYVRLPSIPATDVRLLRGYQADDTTSVWGVRVTTSGYLAITDFDGVGRQVSNSTLATNTIYRVEAYASPTQLNLRYYAGESTTQLGMGAATASTQIPWSVVRFGAMTSANATWTGHLAAVAWSPNTWIGPAV